MHRHADHHDGAHGLHPAGSRLRRGGALALFPARTRSLRPRTHGCHCPHQKGPASSSTATSTTPHTWRGLSGCAPSTFWKPASGTTSSRGSQNNQRLHWHALWWRSAQPAWRRRRDRGARARRQDVLPGREQGRSVHCRRRAPGEHENARGCRQQRLSPERYAVVINERLDHLGGTMSVIVTAMAEQVASTVHRRPIGQALIRTGALIVTVPWTVSYYREEFADHGRPSCGRQGGEFSHQPTQAIPRHRSDTVEGGSDQVGDDPGEYLPRMH